MGLNWQPSLRGDRVGAKDTVRVWQNIRNNQARCYLEEIGGDVFQRPPGQPPGNLHVKVTPRTSAEDVDTLLATLVQRLAGGAPFPHCCRPLLYHLHPDAEYWPGLSRSLEDLPPAQKILLALPVAED